MVINLAPVNGVMNIWVDPTLGGESRPITSDTLYGIWQYYWSEDSEYLLYIQDIFGDENWRLYAVQVESGKVMNLTPYDTVKVREIHLSQHFPDELLVSMFLEDIANEDVYRVNIATGETHLVAENPGNVSWWYVDDDLGVRASTTVDNEGSVHLMVRDSEKGAWRELTVWASEEWTGSRPLAFVKHGKASLVKDSRGANTSRLIEIDIETGATLIVAEDPQYDVSEIVWHPESHEVQAVSFIKDRSEVVVLDKSIQSDIEALQTADLGDFSIHGRYSADSLWLVSYASDMQPMSYYLYNRHSQTLTLLFHTRPNLNRLPLVPVEPFQFTARDGLIIHGYITFPPGEVKTGLPMVVLVHGGPAFRDYWEYNSETQWLANRGYICLQVNYRGSAGFGKEFLAAAYKDWGGKMQDDLTDAVNWAIAKGYADPEKVGIFGWSYGGYAALTAVTFTPDLFACAVDGCGPSNLISLIQASPARWKKSQKILYDRMGNPETEAEFLKSRSSLFHVEKINAPILIVQGARDPRVPESESDQIVDALKARGLPYEYMVFEDEGHVLYNEQNRIEFYQTAERFLAKYLGGRCDDGL